MIFENRKPSVSNLFSINTFQSLLKILTAQRLQEIKFHEIPFVHDPTGNYNKPCRSLMSTLDIATPRIMSVTCKHRAALLLQLLDRIQFINRTLEA